MATTSTKEPIKSKKGDYFELRQSMPGTNRLTMRWYVPEAWHEWSARTKEKELNRQLVNFEAACKSGEFKSHREIKAAARLEALEKQKIKTLKQYGEQVFMPSKQNLAKNTIAYYSDALERFIYPALGDFKLPDITAADIKAFYLKLDNVKKAGTDKPISWNTKRGVHVTLNNLMKMAYQDDVIEKNPCDKVKPPKRGKDNKKDVEVFTDEEIKLILSALPSLPLKWRCYFLIAFETGARRGEIAGLQWRSIDLQNNCFMIENNLVQLKGQTPESKKTKSGKARKAFISPQLAQLLKEYRKQQAAELGGIAQFVFTQRDSFKPMEPKRGYDEFKRFCNTLGIEHAYLHKVRHTWATQAINNGVGVYQVQQALGHADIGTTQHFYMRADDEAQRRASEQYLNALYSQKAELFQ